MRPADVNRGLNKQILSEDIPIYVSIASLEDHGYQLETGIKDLSLFLGSKSKKHEYSIGKNFFVKIKSHQDKNSSVFSANAIDISSFVLTSKTVNFSLLYPGLIFSSKIFSQEQESLTTRIGSMDVKVPFLHLPPDFQSSKSDIKVRIYEVDVDNKHILASTLPHLLQNRALKPKQVIIPGTKLNECQILKNLKNKVVFSMSGTRIVVNKSLIKQDYISDLTANRSFECRVMDFSIFDGYYVGNMQQNVLSEDYLALSTIRPGDILNAKFKEMKENGAIFQIGHNISGFVPILHFSDLPLKNPEKVFSSKPKVKCMALSPSKSGRGLQITLRTSLVHAVLPVLGSKDHDPSKNNCIVMGYVVHRSEKGVLLAGCGNATGFILASELGLDSTNGNSWFREGLFEVGSVLKCRVIALKSTNPNPFFFLSLDLKSETKKSSKSFVGFICKCNVRGVTASGLKVSLKIDKKTTQEAILPFPFYSDSIGLNALFEELCTSGRVFQEENSGFGTDVVVVDDTNWLVSAKESLIQAAKNGHSLFGASVCENIFVRPHSKLREGDVCLGWISQHRAYGVLVKFPSGVIALAPYRSVADHVVKQDEEQDYISYWQERLPIGLTVEAKIVKIDKKNRNLVSLKCRDLYQSPNTERENLMNLLARNFFQRSQNLAYKALGQKIGAKVLFTPKKSQKEGYAKGKVKMGKETIKARMNSFLLEDKEEVECKVITLENEEAILMPCLDGESPPLGVVLKTTVVYTNADITLVKLPKPFFSFGLLSGRICPNQWENNPIFSDVTGKEIGDELEVKVLDPVNDSLYMCQLLDEKEKQLKNMETVQKGQKVSLEEFTLMAINDSKMLLRRGSQRFSLHIADFSQDLDTCLKLFEQLPIPGTLLSEIVDNLKYAIVIDEAHNSTINLTLAKSLKLIIGQLVLGVIRKKSGHQVIVDLPIKNKGLLHKSFCEKNTIPKANLTRFRIIHQLQNGTYVLSTLESHCAKKWKPSGQALFPKLKVGDQVEGYIWIKCSSGLVVSVNPKKELLVPMTKEMIAQINDSLNIGDKIKAKVIESSSGNAIGCVEDLSIKSKQLMNEAIANLSALIEAKNDGLFEGIYRGKRTKTDDSNKGSKKAKTILDKLVNKYAEFEYPTNKMEVDEVNEEEEEEEEEVEEQPMVGSSSKKELVDDFIDVILNDVGSKVSYKTISVEQCETEVRNQPKNPNKWVQYMLLLLRSVQLDRMRVVFERAMTELGRNPGGDSDTARGKVLFVALSIEAGLLHEMNMESAMSKLFFHGAEASASRGQVEQNQLDRVTVMLEKLQAIGQVATVRAVCDRLSDLSLFELAEQVAKSLVKGSKAQEPADWLNLVKVRLRAGKTTEAREAEASAAKLLRVPLIPTFVCSVSQLELKFGDMDRALKLLQEQIAAHPHRKNVHLAYVKALVECQRTREAKQASDKALSLVKNIKKEDFDKILFTYSR